MGHGTSLVAIFFLRNALEFDYAPSLYAFFAATMLMHSSASAFMYSGFLILKLFTPLWPHRRALFAKFFMCASALKSCIMLVAYTAGWWNYRLFFNDQTFYLRDHSTAKWNNDPYFVERLSWREYLMHIPYSDVLMVLLPIIWTFLLISQSFNTWLQFTIGFYEIRVARAQHGNGIATNSKENGVKDNLEDGQVKKTPDGVSVLLGSTGNARLKNG